MAKVETVTLIDDVDGTVADETVEFGVDGKAYEIDLSGANAARLREALAEFAAKGRRLTGRARPSFSRAATASTTSDREQTRAMREWANGNGFTVSDRGRLPVNVIEAYNKRNRGSGTATVTPIRPAAPEAPEVAVVQDVTLTDAGQAKVAAHADKDTPKKAAAKKATKAGLPKVEPKPKGVKVQAMSGMQVAAVENFKLPTHEVAKSFVVFAADSPAEVLGKIRAVLQDYDGPKNSGDYAAMKAVIRALEAADPKKVKVVEVAA